ncbi:MAG: DUF6569 family protein [Planctomycetaceae bacterium]
MRRYLPVVPLLALAAVVCVFLSVERPQKSTLGSGAAFVNQQLSDLIVAAPINHKNLTIFPIFSKTAKTDDLYITLDDGLAAGTVEIYEVGSDGRRMRRENANNAAPVQPAVPQANTQQPVAEQGAASNRDVQEVPFIDGPQNSAEVNRLMLVNRSGKPLYLMPGEVIVGGSQDRTIANEHIIASNDKPVSIDVFCVEHGRWGGREGEAGETVIAGVVNANLDVGFMQGSRTVARRDSRALAEKANEGKFVVSVGSLNKGARLAVQDSAEQGKVWEEVEKTVKNVSPYLETLSLVVDTGSFTSNFVGGDVVKRLDPYLKELGGPVAERDNIVGVVVAINGKIEAVDVFQSTPLFRKLWPKLLKSYALDAAGAADEVAGKSTPTTSVNDSRDFLKKSLFANVAKSETTPGGLTVTRRETDGVISFSADFDFNIQDGGGAYGGGGIGGAVHTSGFAAP